VRFNHVNPLYLVVPMKIALRHFLVLLIAVFSFSGNGFGQCVGSVSYAGWTHYGTTAGQWNTSNAPTSVNSTANTNHPTFFVSPDTFINVKFSGDIMVNIAFDDDYIGFVMGYQGPYNLTAANSTAILDMDMVVFDWKQSYQNYLGNIAQAGPSLNDVDGNYSNTNASIFPGFWEHNNSTTWNVLASNWGNANGWTDFTTYHFDIVYTPTRIIVWIDNVLTFDVTGCFEPGRIGFYNYSQEAAVYSNFTYELYIDFQIESQDVCIGDTAFFTLADTACFAGNSLTNIDTFYWDLGDGTLSGDTNPWHLYTVADTFNVSLIATDINGCTDTMSKDIRVYGLPESHFSMYNFCEGDSSIFIDQTQIIDDSVAFWHWDFGDGSVPSTDTTPVYSYASAGSYNMYFAVQTLAGCVDTIDTTVTIFDPPTPNFSIQSACEGDSVYFTNLSTVNAFPIDSYTWDVQNNQSVDYTSWDVAHLYPVYDIYAVKLELTDTYGCVDSLIKIVDVHPLPVADFAAPGVCFGDQTLFYDSSEVVNGNVIDWLWVLNGGGDTLSGETPSFTFSQDGFHTVTLIVTTDSGCVDQVTKNVQVYELPSANFTSNAACEDESMAFTQMATTPFGVVDQWSWNFGNNTSSSSNPLNAFSAPGTHEVQLAIETNLGCKDTIQKTVRVYPLPSAFFTWDNNVCEGNDLSFQDQSNIVQISPGGDSIVQWNWTMNGSTQYIVENPVFPTNTFSSVYTRLVIESNQGCIDSMTATAKVFQNPTADFSFDPACAKFESAFTNQSTVTTGLVDQFVWSFGDGATSSSENPTHAYQAPGEYDVKLFAVSNKDCPDSLLKTVVIPESPQVDFQFLDSVACSPVVASIENLSSINLGGLRYEWFVDNEFLTSAQSPQLLLENAELEPKSFDIMLRATSDKNCVTSKRKNDLITVLPAPIADFKLGKDTIEPFDESVPFINSSTNGVKWLWNFDNGTTSEEFEPLYSYPESGTYFVRLRAENIWQCADSTFRKLVVDPFITMYVPTGFTPNGDGINDVWEVQGFNEERELALRVYDRWGSLIFYTTDLEDHWDGTINETGNLVPGGVYVYKLVFYINEFDVKEVTGEITVVR
jgi:gliding motility-associated-like protein